ncbi:GxGYxYP domain-containing protein [Compostimonas suwonensis]|uniref:Putative glycoside hydrolase with GxGYxYP motif n=1 Tax=Compostimonas suwonensis TaxID=1048394 RepID=A0A2M9BVA1_9MICO|nr:GxGYxYP domain-containing protein [Compostimonas suwonensis]PJJ61875.1 putative glycoside hydrolase with GxGYxYP motif [Compostimonas suwonensis]
MTPPADSSAAPVDPQLFPRAGTAPESLVTLDVRVGHPDGDTPDAAAAAKVLQGLVNRRGAEKLYLYNSCSDITHQIGGAEWEVQRDWLRALPQLESLPTTELVRHRHRDGGLRRLLEVYGDTVTGVVVWDPRRRGKVAMATFGAAVTIASQREAVPVSPELLDELRGWGIDLPVIEDLRDHGFRSDHEVVEWSVREYWATSDTTLNVVFSLGLDGWQGIQEWADNWWSNDVFNEGPIDYAVAVNGFCFNLDMVDGYDDHALLDLLSRYPAGRTAILGWVPTHPVVYGFAEMPQCLNLTSSYVIGVNGFSNLSVFASYPPTARTPGAGRSIPIGERDTVIALIATDGDALHCVYRGMFSAFSQRRDDTFGATPITWTISPALAELAPPLFDYFDRQLPEGSDFAAAWANKIQTPYDSDLQTAVDDVYARSVRAGIRTLWTVHSGEESQLLPAHPWDGLIIGYADSREEARLSAANPVVPVIGTWSFGANEVEETADGLRALSATADGPLFLVVNLGAEFDEAADFSRRASELRALLENDPRRSYHFLGAADLFATYTSYVAALESTSGARA